jgi:sortase A
MKLSTGKKIVGLLAALLATFFILEFNYFWANVKFLFYKPSPVSQTLLISGQPAKMQANMLIIDSLGIKAPIVYIEGIGEKYFQAGLLNGVVHYPGTANPGQLGNCYIFGHSSDYIWSKGHYKSVFAVLPQIKIGANITIGDQQGNKFVYTVTDSRSVAASDTSVLSQQNNAKKLLTLQTSYPVGTALARWVVVAEIK